MDKEMAKHVAELNEKWDKRIIFDGWTSYVRVGKGWAVPLDDAYNCNRNWTADGDVKCEIDYCLGCSDGMWCGIPIEAVERIKAEKEEQDRFTRELFKKKKMDKKALADQIDNLQEQLDGSSALCKEIDERMKQYEYDGGKVPDSICIEWAEATVKRWKIMKEMIKLEEILDGE